MARFDMARLYNYALVPACHDYHCLRKVMGLYKEDDIASCDLQMYLFLVKMIINSGQIKGLPRDPESVAMQKLIIDTVLEQGPCLSKYFSKEEFGSFSLLWIAVLAGFTDSAELLIRCGADVNEPFGRRTPQVVDEKLTVLHALVLMDISPANERLIRLLIEHGADLQARTSRGRSLLHYVVRHEQDRTYLAKELLEKGVDANVADECGATPLLEAAHSCRASELLPLLVEHGADVLAKDKVFEQNVLHRLARSPGEGLAGLAEVLIAMGVSIEDKDDTMYHFQPMHLAVIAGKNELVELYLNQGANINALLALNDLSPVHLASRFFAGKWARQDLLRILLSRGANMELKTTEGRTALHEACEYSTEECIEMLVSAGADIHTEDQLGNTPFAIISPRKVEERKIGLMIRMLALKKVCQPEIELKDKSIIESNPSLFNYYKDCIEEIERMKTTRFIDTCTFYELLTKNQCQVAALMQNKEFEDKFRIYNIKNGFSIYGESLHEAFDRGKCHYDARMEQSEILSEAINYVLPWELVKMVVDYVFECN